MRLAATSAKCATFFMLMTRSLSLLQSEVEGTVNIASGEPITIRSLVEHIAALLNSRDRVEFGAIAAAPNDPPFLVADTRRLREEVGWQPRITLEDGLEDTINWWRKELAAPVI